MGLILWVYGIDSIGLWNSFHRTMELSPLTYGIDCSAVFSVDFEFHRPMEFSIALGTDFIRL